MKTTFFNKHLLLIIFLIIFVVSFPFLIGFIFFGIPAMLCDPHCNAEKVIQHTIPKTFPLESYIDICEGFGCDTDTTTIFKIPVSELVQFEDDLKESGWKQGTLAEVKQYLPDAFLPQHQLSGEEEVVFRYVPTFFNDGSQTVSKYVLSFLLFSSNEFVVYESSI